MISFVLTLPLMSMSTMRSCWASDRPTGITIRPPALSWLIKWNEVGRRCDDNLVERCVLGPAEITVPDANLDVGIAFSFEPLHCPLCELVDDFDGVHLARQLGEHCGLIAEASANLEDHVVRFELEQVRHYRNHERLRDRLIKTDW